MNEIKKESKYIFNKESPGRKVPILLIYPIYFLAGMGIMLILAWLTSIVAWLNDESLNFNLIFKSWSSLIAFFIGAIFFSGFVLLWHEHIEEFEKGQRK